MTNEVPCVENKPLLYIIGGVFAFVFIYVPIATAVNGGPSYTTDGRPSLMQAVERELEPSLRDPDSLSIEGVTRVDDTMVRVVYRARNGFGGMSREAAYLRIPDCITCAEDKFGP